MVYAAVAMLSLGQYFDFFGALACGDYTGEIVSQDPVRFLVEVGVGIVDFKP